MKTVILGFDAFDPRVFERLSSRGGLVNLTAYAEAAGYARLSVADPPQTEVSWTSIATGLNPGGHGIFDFVHRDPATYVPYVSLLPTQRSIGGVTFVPPSTARTLFEEATRLGFPATSLWWPATFPARPELPVRTIPGLGTPDIQGRLGVGSLFSSHIEESVNGKKTRIAALETSGRGRYSGWLEGPSRKTRAGAQPSAVRFELEMTGEKTCRLRVDGTSVDLIEGVWSPIIEVGFKLGVFMRVVSVTRAVLNRVDQHVHLYFLPLQIQPLRSPFRYATPGSFVKRLWQLHGPFLTLGWPQDTTALEEGCITDDQFLALCDSILATRERVLMGELDGFTEGVLASVFDSLDRIQHMFWRDRPDVVESWYEKLDGLVGRVKDRLSGSNSGPAKLLVISDHGFSHFDFKVHLNHWLIENGFLGVSGNPESGALRDVDWSASQAYALGLNSLYVNRVGREGQGAVTSQACGTTADRLREQLLQWRGPDGRPVVQKVLLQEEAFEGPLSAYGPDLVVGYAPGYRASSETGTGKWGKTSVVRNSDHWGADHCIDSQAVPGVLFCNEPFSDLPSPSYRDVPAIAIGRPLEHRDSAPPPSVGSEDQETLEERLRGLGYL
jgi:predicted AlkP superfamily phosphohydrolase/phosphomutase